MKSKRTLYNIVFGFGSQFIIIVLGLIVPRIILTHYGSDTNGLTSTVTQIFTYMALLEAGIGQATRNALYKYVEKKDKSGISYVMSISRRYYRKITLFYFVGVLVISFLLPFIIKSNVSYFTIFFVVLFEGLSGVISFWYIQNWTQLLIAEGKNYVRANVDMINRVLCYGAKIVLACMGVNIALIQCSYFIISIIKLLFYKAYFRKNYSWIDYDAAPQSESLPDRNAYIITELAWTIFSSTDMIVLSMFCSTELASVYAIYNLVFSNIHTLLNSVYQGVQFLLGQTYHESKEKYLMVHDSFNSVFMCTMTALMSISYIMILPFVRLYTSGVNDVEYIYTGLPVMFCMVQLLSWSRYVGGNLTGIAGYAKQVSYISLIEAITNIICSIILVQCWGIVGAISATVIALPLKVIYVTYVADVKILKRNVWKTVSILFVNYIAFFFVVGVSKYLSLDIHGYGSFVKWGVVLSICIFPIVVFANVIANPQSVKWVIGFLKKKHGHA